MKRSITCLCPILLIVTGLSACKTNSTEKWTTRDTPIQKTQKHFAGNFKLGKDEEGRGRMVKLNKDGSESEDSSADIGRRNFDGEKAFKGDNRNVSKKAFDTKKFGGKSEFNRDGYHFIKEREKKQKQSALQNKMFATNETEDTKKSWFGRKREVNREGFFAKRKKNKVKTNSFYQTDKATEANRGKSMPIMQMPGQNSGAISIDDIKGMLGRSTVTPAVVNEQSGGF